MPIPPINGDVEWPDVGRESPCLLVFRARLRLLDDPNEAPDIRFAAVCGHSRRNRDVARALSGIKCAVASVTKPGLRTMPGVIGEVFSKAESLLRRRARSAQLGVAPREFACGAVAASYPLT